MQSLVRQLTVSVSLLTLAACATVQQTAPQPPAEAAPPAPVVVEKSAHDRLFDLFKASDEASLVRNPLNALSRGDLRYADRLGDKITDEYFGLIAGHMIDPRVRHQTRPHRRADPLERGLIGSPCVFGCGRVHILR